MLIRRGMTDTEALFEIQKMQYDSSMRDAIKHHKFGQSDFNWDAHAPDLGSAIADSRTMGGQLEAGLYRGAASVSEALGPLGSMLGLPQLTTEPSDDMGKMYSNDITQYAADNKIAM